MSELHLMPAPDALLGLIPLERDITHFGVVILDLGEPPWKEPVATWMTYPNGLDPAPIASGRICGEPVILLARPSNAEPKAPQELVLLSASQALRPQATNGVALHPAPSKAAAPTASVAANASGSVAAGPPVIGQVLVRSRAFYDVSIAPLKGGALVSYVADHRTWAVTLRCPKS